MNNLSEFANDAVRLSAAVQAEDLALADVLSEAVKATESERNGRITVVIAEVEGMKIVGARRDWAAAFANMLRNSTQVRAGKGSVWISTHRDDSGGLHIYVDDDGPGAPGCSAQRGRVDLSRESTRRLPISLCTPASECGMNPKILLIDDNADVLESYRDLLRGGGYTFG